MPPHLSDRLLHVSYSKPTTSHSETNSMTIDARTLKKDWAGFVFDVAKFEVREDVVLSFAQA